MVPPASTASRPALMTLANAPLSDRTSEDVHRIGFLKNRNIFANGAGQRTGQTTELICPSGKSDDPLQQIELYCILNQRNENALAARSGPTPADEDSRAVAAPARVRLP